MTLLIRTILIGIIIYLLFRSFAAYFAEKGSSTQKNDEKTSKKSGGVPKNVGEYTDYEEVD